MGAYPPRPGGHGAGGGSELLRNGLVTAPKDKEPRLLARDSHPGLLV